MSGVVLAMTGGPVVWVCCRSQTGATCNIGPFRLRQTLSLQAADTLAPASLKFMKIYGLTSWNPG